MQALGVKTTLLARNQLLSHVDQELIPHLLESMQKLGLDARLKTPFTKVEKSGDKFKVYTEAGDVLEADRVLCALGRPPLVEPLNL